MKSNTTTLAPARRRTLLVQGKLGQSVAFAGGLGAIFFYYFIVLTDGHLRMFQPVDIGLTFNSMLDHLRHGQFDVGPDAVRFEGFYRDGKTYSYWGIFCALLRLPLLLIPNGLSLDVTYLSCLVAATTGAGVKLLTLRMLVRRLPAALIVSVAVYVVFSGQYFGFLKATVYEEILLWAGTIASAFLLLALRGLTKGRFSPSLLFGMATLAGLGLLCRVTFGIGLYGALGLLLLKLLFDSQGRSLIDRGWVGAVLILIGFMVITGTVNYFRWGSPLTFVDNSGYVMNSNYPDRRVREALYGSFNIRRIPYSLDYYFGIFWTLRNETGFLFSEAHNRLYDVIELPQSSFLLTDLFAFACFVSGAVLAHRQTTVSERWIFAALFGGFTVQSALLLCAISTAYRYRQDFYPLIDLLIFSGLIMLGRVSFSQRNTLRAGLAAAMLVSIVSAHVSLGLYKLSPLGMYSLNVPGSLNDYYVEQFQRRFGRAFSNHLADRAPSQASGVNAKPSLVGSQPPVQE